MFVLLLGSGHCFAAGVRNVDDGWLLGPGGAAAFLSQRAGRSLGVWSTVGQAQLHNLTELPVTRFALGLRLGKSWAAPTLSVSWQGLGEGLYREQTRQFHLQWGKYFVLGLAGLQAVVETGGGDFERQRDSYWHLQMTGHLTWQVSSNTQVRGEVWLPLTSSEDAFLRTARRRLVRLQGWRERVAFGLTVDLKTTQQPTVSLEWDLAWGAVALGLRLDPSTAVMGPVLYVSRGKVLIQTSHLVHPQLGVTHRLQVGLGSWGAARW